MAFLLSLPIAFLALVPADAVSGGLTTCSTRSRSCSRSRPRCRPSTTRSAAPARDRGPLLHLAVLAVAFAALARLALRRFA